MTGAAMRLFYAGNSVPETYAVTVLSRAKNAMYATHRVFGALLLLKDLSTTLLALFGEFGALRRMPTAPKDAKKCVWTPWRSSAFGNARDESAR
jgi:hypothetical protein